MVNACIVKECQQQLEDGVVRILHAISTEYPLAAPPLPIEIKTLWKKDDGTKRNLQ